MKKFGGHILKFLAFCLLFLFAMFAINTYNFSKYTPEIANKRILILGDSHPQFGVNPIKFESAVNLSQPAEPYALSYWKLKYFVAYYKPDTLVLGFAPHNLAGFNDLKFTDKTWSNEMFLRAYSLEPFIFLEPLEMNYKEYAKLYTKQMLLIPKTDHVNFIGAFSTSKKSNLKKVNKPINRHYHSVTYAISETNERYLDSILSFCRTNAIAPVLVSPPVHRKYFELIPEENMTYYTRKKNALQNEGVLVIDHSNTVYADSLFFNFDHLNVYGANTFTEQLLKQL